MQYTNYTPKYQFYNKKLINEVHKLYPNPTLSKSRFLIHLAMSPPIDEYGCVRIHSDWLKSHFKGLYQNKRLGLLELLETGLVKRPFGYKEGEKSFGYVIDIDLRATIVIGLALKYRYFDLEKIRINEDYCTSHYSPVIDRLIKYSLDNEGCYMNTENYFDTAEFLFQKVRDAKSRKEQDRIIDRSIIALRQISKKYKQGKFRTAITHFWYRLGVVVTETGRIVEVNGGVQRLPKEFKQANYAKLPNCYNYDIKSSQIAALQVFCEMLHIECSILDEYLKNDNAKEEYAAKCGISIRTWKDCLCALLFGAYSGKKGAPYSFIKDEFYSNYILAEYKYESWLFVIEPFRKVIHEWLSKVRAYAESTIDRDGFIYNATGIKIDYYNNPRCRSRKFLSAFYLQGLEAAFIHTLWMKSVDREYNFKVISPEFDGLVTIGEIPDNAITTAQIQSGFINAKLVKKDFIENLQNGPPY
jgi:hypothetical protein